MREFTVKEAIWWLEEEGYHSSGYVLCRACRKAHILAEKRSNPKGQGRCWIIPEAALREYRDALLPDAQLQISRQQLYAILEWIREYTATRGFPPSLREIREGCSLSSTSVVSHYLRVLERLGEIAIAKNTARGIRVNT